MSEQQLSELRQGFDRVSKMLQKSTGRMNKGYDPEAEINNAVRSGFYKSIQSNGGAFDPAAIRSKMSGQFRAREIQDRQMLMQEGNFTLKHMEMVQRGIDKEAAAGKAGAIFTKSYTDKHIGTQEYPSVLKWMAQMDGDKSPQEIQAHYARGAEKFKWTGIKPSKDGGAKVVKRDMGNGFFQYGQWMDGPGGMEWNPTSETAMDPPKTESYTHIGTPQPVRVDGKMRSAYWDKKIKKFRDVEDNKPLPNAQKISLSEADDYTASETSGKLQRGEKVGIDERRVYSKWWRDAHTERVYRDPATGTTYTRKPPNLSEFYDPTNPEKGGTPKASGTLTPILKGKMKRMSSKIIDLAGEAATLLTEATKSGETITGPQGWLKAMGGAAIGRAVGLNMTTKSKDLDRTLRSLSAAAGQFLLDETRGLSNEEREEVKEITSGVKLFEDEEDVKQAIRFIVKLVNREAGKIK